MKIIFYFLFLLMGLFAKDVDLSIELNSWKTLAYVGSAKNNDELSSAMLSLNQASLVGLVNKPKIKYIKTPVKEGGSVSYGGMFQIDIKEKGIYRVALGNASWIDLVKDGNLVQSVAHKGGPENSGIRKMVDYPLEVGIYTLQLSAGGDSTTALLVAKIK